MKMYGIYETVYEDGGYGDMVLTSRTLFVTDDKDKAEEYVEKWTHPTVYDRPYDKLIRHDLFVSELDELPDISTPPRDTWLQEIEEDERKFGALKGGIA